MRLLNALIQVNPEVLYEKLKISVVAQSTIVPSRKESLIVITDNENVNIEKDYFIRDFTPQMSLLHHIVNKIFFPKVDRFDFVGQRDLYIMYHIMIEKPTNLLGMIISHMVDQIKRKSGSLPYGMVLIVLFENAEIDLSNEISQKLLHSDTYNKKSLRRMRYVKVEDQWICRESQIDTSNITKDEPKEN